MPNARKSNRKRQIETLLRDPRPVVYANNTTVSITPWDFAFQFGTIAEISEKKLKIQEQAFVYMSPQHAKVFLGLVARQVKLYEEKYSTIPEPKQAKEIVEKKLRPTR